MSWGCVHADKSPGPLGPMVGPRPRGQEPTQRAGSPCSDQCTWEETLAAEPRAQGGRLARGQHPDRELLIGPPGPRAAPRWLDRLLEQLCPQLGWCS